jgi:hypothetical protein
MPPIYFFDISQSHVFPDTVRLQDVHSQSRKCCCTVTKKVGKLIYIILVPLFGEIQKVAATTEGGNCIISYSVPIHKLSAIGIEE